MENLFREIDSIGNTVFFINCTHIVKSNPQIMDIQAFVYYNCPIWCNIALNFIILYD